jgi:hypothetical protein
MSFHLSCKYMYIKKSKREEREKRGGGGGVM